MMFKIELAGFDFDSRARGNRQGLTLAPVSPVISGPLLFQDPFVVYGGYCADSRQAFERLRLDINLD